MSRDAAERIDARKLTGFKYFRKVAGLFDRLHDAGTERDRAGNRKLFFDQYAMLMLLYFFNPIVDSLRGLRELTTLDRVQRVFGVKPTAIGSLSEASRVFDPALLEPIIAELAGRARRESRATPPAERAALAGLVAVDGSLLRALPRMAWALWQDDAHRAAKVHVAFAVFPSVPAGVSVTAAVGSEREEWRRMVEPGGFYVCDRGYANYALFRELDEKGCRFVVRIQQNAVWETAAERELTEADRAAGVIEDVTVRRLGAENLNPPLDRPLRVVVVEGSQPGHRWVLATNALDLPAELVAVAYHHRWEVELYFRWLKCVLGCRHLLSHGREGVTLQVYFAIIASLLIGLWVGRKPTKRTYEMFCLYLAGWATEEELDAHLEKLHPNPKPP